VNNFSIALWHFLERLICWVFELLLRIFHIPKTPQRMARLMQFAKFCIVGVSNSVVDFLVYSAAIGLFAFLGWNGTLLWPVQLTNMNVQLATFFGFFAAMLNSFHWNRRYVFKTNSDAAVRIIFFKVAVTYTLILIVKIQLNRLWCGPLPVPTLLINPLNQFLTIPMGYLLNKYWAYR